MPLEDALKFTHLSAEKEQWDKYERAATKWLRLYLTEASPTLREVAKHAEAFVARLDE